MNRRRNNTTGIGARETEMGGMKTKGSKIPIPVGCGAGNCAGCVSQVPMAGGWVWSPVLREQESIDAACIGAGRVLPPAAVEIFDSFIKRGLFSRKTLDTASRS